MSGVFPRFCSSGLAALLLIPGTLYAATLTQNLSLIKATLYLQGAELQNTATVEVPKGESELVFGQIAQAVNPDSLSVNLGQQVKIIAIDLRHNYLQDLPVSDKAKQLQTELDKLLAQQKQLQIALTAAQQEEKYLQNNQLFKLSADKASLNSAKNAMNFIRDRLVQNLTEQQTMQQKLDELKKPIQKLQQEVEQAQGQVAANQDAIVVKIDAPQAMTLPVAINYFTQQASWSPQYEVRVADIDQPLQLNYKANIYQHTGLNWSNVLLNLSSANPAFDLQLPRLPTWHVDLAKPARPQPLNVNNSEFTTLARSSAKMAQYADNATLDNHGINVQYQLNQPYTIQSQTSATQVVLTSKQFNATYHYIATPKLNSATYLVAQLDKQQTLNLLPGQATIFYQDSYMGHQWLSTHNSQPTLEIALGRDDNILVERQEDLQQTQAPAVFGKSLTQKFAYTIKVVNQKAKPIDIIVYDQLPVLHDDSISITDRSLSQANYNEQTGELSWSLTVAPKSQKQLPFSFSLQYPQTLRGKISGL